MTSLILTVGLPGSGKSYEAKLWVDKNRDHRVRVNRDELRAMMHGSRLGTRRQEQQVSTMQQAGVIELLEAGTSVIIDDTNLNPEFRQTWLKVARAGVAKLVVWDFTNVPTTVCLGRNEQRDGAARLDEEVILDMELRWITGPESRGEDPLADVRDLVTRSLY